MQETQHSKTIHRKIPSKKKIHPKKGLELADSGRPPVPDEIISNILTRLPAKMICRFKCVSKGWYSIICNPHFISSYNSKSSLSWAIFDKYIRVNPESKRKSKRNTELNLQWKEPPNVSILSVNRHKLIDKSIETIIKDHEFPAILIASSNGFLLFSIKIERNRSTDIPGPSIEDSLFVINSITCEWVSIPKLPHYIDRESAVGFITEVNKQSGVLERFMIADYQSMAGFAIATMMYFSSENGRWEQIATNYMLGWAIWKAYKAIELDGHLIWCHPRVLITWDEPFSGKTKVHCRSIMLPRLNLGSDEDRFVDVGGGYIHFLDVSDKENNEFSLWRLHDYEGGQWSLVHKLSFMDVWRDESYLAYGLEEVMPTLYVMHPFEADIAYCLVGDRVFSLNLGTKKVESCGVYSSLSRNHIDFIIVKLPCLPLSFPPSSKAAYWKDQGNRYFRAKNFNKAINCYTRSINLAENVIVYTNRGMANINVCRYQEAEADFTEALKLRSEFYKAYEQRAVARIELGDLTGCVKDLESALKLKPDDQKMKNFHAEVKSLIDEKVNRTETAPVLPTDPPVQNDS